MTDMYSFGRRSGLGDSQGPISGQHRLQSYAQIGYLRRRSRRPLEGRDRSWALAVRHERRDRPAAEPRYREAVYRQAEAGLHAGSMAAGSEAHRRSRRRMARQRGRHDRKARHRERSAAARNTHLPAASAPGAQGLPHAGQQRRQARPIRPHRYARQRSSESSAAAVPIVEGRRRSTEYARRLYQSLSEDGEPSSRCL